MHPMATDREGGRPMKLAVGRCANAGWMAKGGHRPGPCSSWPLTHDLGRVLVVAESEKAWLSQPTVARPFGKSDLSDEHGPRPVCATGDRASVHKRRLGRLQLPQQNAEIEECRLGVAGADLPGVAEGATGVVTDEASTKV